MNSKQQYLTARKEWTIDYNSLSNLIRVEKQLLKQMMRSFQYARQMYWNDSKNIEKHGEYIRLMKAKDKSHSDLINQKREANKMLANLILMKEESAKRRLEALIDVKPV